MTPGSPENAQTRIEGHGIGKRLERSSWSFRTDARGPRLKAYRSTGSAPIPWLPARSCHSRVRADLLPLPLVAPLDANCLALIPRHCARSGVVIGRAERCRCLCSAPRLGRKGKTQSVDGDYWERHSRHWRPSVRHLEGIRRSDASRAKVSWSAWKVNGVCWSAATAAWDAADAGVNRPGVLPHVDETRGDNKRRWRPA